MISNIEELIESLLEKELIVNNFSVPKFIKVRDSLGLIKFLKNILNNKEKKYNLINLLGSEEVAIFNKYFDNNRFKDINLTTSTSNSPTDFHKNNDNNLAHHNDKKDFSIINKKSKVITVLEQDINHTKDHFNKNKCLFYSYLDRLRKITDDVKKLNEAKLFKANNINNHFHKNLSNKKEIFNDYKYIRSNSNLKSTFNHIKNNHTINTGCKNSINTQNIGLNNRSKMSTNEHKVGHNILQNNLDKSNNLYESFGNFTHKQHDLYSELVSGLNSKIDNLVKVLKSYFEEIINKLSNFSSNNDEVTSEVLKNGFKDLSNTISDIKRLCDLNGLDIDNLNDSLNKIDFHELIELLKEININTHKLINKQEKLNQDEIEVSNEIKSLESHLKTYNKEQLDILTKQINVLEKKQSEYSLTQVENRDIIINEIKNILNILKSTSNPTLELQERLNSILKKQENLFEEALNIKNYILSNKKDNIVEENKSEKGLHVLIEEIKSNNNVVKEQNVFNEKIHKDMEIIKKSIIKLIDEQAKENNKVLNTPVEKSLKEKLPKQDNKHSSNKNNFLNNENIENDSEYNTKKVSQEINNNKVISNKDLHKSNQVKMAIGKLKEALDLDSIHTIKELSTEYIDEIIEEKIIDKHSLGKVQNNSGTNSNISNVTQGKVNSSELKNEIQETNKKNQSTFVLDNSKFFK